MDPSDQKVKILSPTFWSHRKIVAFHTEKPRPLTVTGKGYRLTVMPACKLTPEAEVEILNLVAAGNTLNDAVRAVGVVSETARNWVKWGNAGREPYAEFVAKLGMAKAKAMTSYNAAINVATITDWRAAKFQIERIEKRQVQEHQDAGRYVEAILQIVEQELGKLEAKRVLRAIVERFGGQEVGGPGTPLRLVTGE